MKRTLLALSLAALAAGAAAAAEAVPWGAAQYQVQFKYFVEYGTYGREDWEALPAAERDQALQEAGEPGERRLAEVAGYYEAVMRPWDDAAMREFCSGATADDIKRVKIWMGALKGTFFENKLALVRRLLNKAQAEGLEAADEAALRPHLQPQVIEHLRSKKFAAEMARRAAEKPRPSLSQSSDRLGKLGPDLDGGKLSGMYDNARAGSGNTALAGGAATLAAGASMAPAAAMRTTNATTLGHTAPAALAEQKSSAWTSDAYGITVKTVYGDKPFRNPEEAEAYIRTLPPSTIKEIKLYGHGSPGLQTVGPASYDSGSTVTLLKGKMANGGLVQFVGCNTASIGDSTLNPATGLSMAARRLLYFSVPYWGDRLDGVPADQAKQQWEKEWNADLARDTSIGLAANNNVIVCGYRTFGLVPGRLPVLTRVLGTQEDTDPTLVIGKKVCYQNGREVPAP